MPRLRASANMVAAIPTSNPRPPKYASSRWMAHATTPSKPALRDAASSRACAMMQMSNAQLFDEIYKTFQDLDWNRTLQKAQAERQDYDFVLQHLKPTTEYDRERIKGLKDVIETLDEYIQSWEGFDPLTGEILRSKATRSSRRKPQATRWSQPTCKPQTVTTLSAKPLSCSSGHCAA